VILGWLKESPKDSERIFGPSKFKPFF
jgi:hypothetical protein